MLKDEFPDDADDWGYYHARAKIRNTDLQKKYDEMHKQGHTSWFSDGREERETILKMGESWVGLRVLEIGCGEGELGKMLIDNGAVYTGIDYSCEAIKKAHDKYPGIMFLNESINNLVGLPYFPRLVMQGVLEHLDDPFTELKWMMDNLLGEHGDVITSSPCFLNPRGIVWMTLDMLGAVMSKTDLHYLNPWQFEEFCSKHGYGFKMQDCDYDWGEGDEMIYDFEKRIPLALKDGGIQFDQNKVNMFLKWLTEITLKRLNGSNSEFFYGATMVYKISKG